MFHARINWPGALVLVFGLLFALTWNLWFFVVASLFCIMACCWQEKKEK